MRDSLAAPPPRGRQARRLQARRLRRATLARRALLAGGLLPGILPRTDVAAFDICRSSALAAGGLIQRPPAATFLPNNPKTVLTPSANWDAGNGNGRNRSYPLSRMGRLERKWPVSVLTPSANWDAGNGNGRNRSYPLSQLGRLEQKWPKLLLPPQQNGTPGAEKPDFAPTPAANWDAGNGTATATLSAPSFRGGRANVPGAQIADY